MRAKTLVSKGHEGYVSPLPVDMAHSGHASPLLRAVPASRSEAYPVVGPSRGCETYPVVADAKQRITRTLVGAERASRSEAYPVVGPSRGCETYPVVADTKQRITRTLVGAQGASHSEAYPVVADPRILTGAEGGREAPSGYRPQRVAGGARRSGGWCPRGQSRGAPARATFAGVAAFLMLALGAPGAGAQENDLGKATYDRWCAGCHGVEGDGRGVAAEYMLPRPRDFTLALYQIRTTASGELPTDADIRHVIDRGMPSTTMPAWEDLLSEQERDALVEYLKTFSRFFGLGDPPQAIDFGRAPRVSDAVLAEGAEQFEAMECFKCHGTSGRGDGTSAPTLDDDLGFPIRAADLTENWKFNGGGSVEDIYRRLRTGLDGTPMPSYQDVVDAGVITNEQLWSLAHYVRSLSPEAAPGINEVIRAELLEDGALPTSPDDPVWEGVGASYIPMVGQILQKPRWFDPRVDGIWVQALHDGQELVMRIRWSDPSQSPDPEWADWKSRLIELMEPKEGDPPEAGSTPDQLVVQFPKVMPTGMERPYFLMGDQGNPVYQWQWRSDRQGALEAEARGLGTSVALPPGEQALTAAATFMGGQWSVLFRRSITTEGASDLDFPTGEAVPVAFFAWDGDNGESGTRSAISTWYFIFLQEPTPASVFVAPLVAMMLTGGLGLFVVGRAQKREWEGVAIEGGGATSEE